jgi:DNA-binding NtrC family response regulator
MAQAKILRVLQEQVVERVGSHEPVELDIRLITATNVDLRQAVDRKEFREDLYYRLHVMPIFIPPLRERTEDIPHLVNYYAERFCREMKKPLLKITEEVMESFAQPLWRGNIRELKNAIERAVILSEDEWLQPYSESPAQKSRQAVLDLEPALNRALSERELVNSYARMAFERFKRFDRTCEFLGISFKTLKKRLELEEKQSMQE